MPPLGPFVPGDSPGKGKGMFAKNDIKQGEKILAETPLAVLDNPTLLQICQAVRDLSEHARVKFIALSPQSLSESNLDELITNIRADNQAVGQVAPVLPGLRYTAAANWVRIYRNNHFKMRDQTDDEDREAILVHGALFNHSCLPNCHASWNQARRQLCIYSGRDIPTGDELLIAYDSAELILQHTSERVRILKERYGFECKCVVCDRDISSNQHLRTHRSEMADHLHRAELFGERDVEYAYVLELMEQDGLMTWEKGKL
jgi:hypothetical protein